MYYQHLLFNFILPVTLLCKVCKACKQAIPCKPCKPCKTCKACKAWNACKACKVCKQYLASIANIANLVCKVCKECSRYSPGKVRPLNQGILIHRPMISIFTAWRPNLPYSFIVDDGKLATADVPPMLQAENHKGARKAGSDQVSEDISTEQGRRPTNLLLCQNLKIFPWLESWLMT